MKRGLALSKGNWQVATKVPPPGAKDQIKNACYLSCRDLGVTCLDLYYLHRIDPKIPIEVSMEAMKELIAEGKIKYVGLVKRPHRRSATPTLCAH